MPKANPKSALCPFVLVLIGVLAAPAAFAEEGSSGAHGDGNGSAAPAQGSGDHSSSNAPAGGAGKGEARSSRGDDGKGQSSGAADHGGTAKDAGPAVQNGKDSTDIDAHAEPPRRLDKNKNKPGDNATLQPPAKEGPRRLSPVPQAPNPVRNAIGVVIPPRERVEPHDAVHPQAPVVARPAPAVTPATPESAAARQGMPEGVSRPAANPVVTPPAANRGAINGTGVTPHNVGPPRIGGPSPSVAGVNGTTIRAKH